MSFDYLLPDNNPRIESFNQILDAFENDAIILLLASGPEDSLKSFAYQIKPLLESFDEWVSSVHTQIPIDFLRNNILKLMTPNDLENFGEIFSDPNFVSFLVNLNNAFESTFLHSNNEITSLRNEHDAVNFLDRLQMFIKAQEEIMQDTESLNVGQQAVDAIVFGEGLNLSPDREMILISIEPGFNMRVPAEKLLRNVNGIEEIIETIAYQHGINAELAGPLIKARDQYTALTSKFWYMFILSLISCSFILIFFFRMWSIPFMCISTLIAGIVCTLGIYSFFMKDITLISILGLIIFVLLGLGNCILLISSFLEKRYQGLNIEVSMHETLQRSGSGMIISGCVVGLIFLVQILSEINVFHDLSILAGIGTITTMMMSVIILPSMFIIKEKFQCNDNLFLPTTNISYSFLGNGVEWIAKNRWLAIIFILITTGFIFHRETQMHVDTNLSNLNPDNSHNIDIEDELIKAFGISSSLISVTADNLATVRVITEQAREIISNGWVESISDYLPDEEFTDEKFSYLRELRRKIKSRELRKRFSSHDMNMYRKEIERLEANIIELQEFSLLKDQLTIYEKTIQLVGDGVDSSFQGILTPFINAMDTGMNRIKLTYFQEQFSSAFKSTILKMANSEPLTLDNLPLDLKARFTGKNDKIFRINIYPNQNIWYDSIFLDRFVNESSALSEKITGWPVLFVELKDRISYYGFQSALLILFTMILLLLASLRSLKYALIIMLSLTSGFIWMLGILIVLKIPLNLMNLWIIPIILAIGLNNSIQLLMRWKKEKNLDLVYCSTGKEIFITTFTIFIIVFPLLFEFHNGLTSFVCVLIIGLWCSFLAHLVVFPALLERSNHLTTNSFLST